jgi:hypothetical protein
MTEDQMKKSAQDMTQTALATLYDVMVNDTKSPEARVAAAKEILLRGWGPVSG